jgi:hypothetical protein
MIEKWIIRILGPNVCVVLLVVVFISVAAWILTLYASGAHFGALPVDMAP